MPQPTFQQLHVDHLLTNLSIARIQDAKNFVANKVFPAVPVEHKSDYYAIYNAGDFNRDEMQVRAPGTESAGSGYNLSKNLYDCKVWSLHKDIPDQIRANSDSVFNLNRDATTFLVNKALIRKERLFAQNFLVTSAWTNYVTGVSSAPSTGQFLQWDQANSTPIEDIRKGITTITSYGFAPSGLIVSRKIFNALIDNAEIVDRVKYGTQQEVSLVDVPELAKLFKIPNVFIMDAVYNSAAEGQTEASTFINNTQALLYYTAPTPGIFTQSAGYDFQWRGLYGGNGAQQIRNYRIEQRAVDRIELDTAYTFQVVDPTLGYLFDSAVAAS